MERMDFHAWFRYNETVNNEIFYAARMISAQLEAEYQVSMEAELGKGLNLMCNLSDVIEEQGIEKGRLETLMGLVKDGLLSTKDAAKRLNLSETQFEKLMKRE